MQPSSLVFLVLIAIWAAYLLQHWVRRREHLATARSVDRFSDAMRVLERRTALPEPDMSAPRPRSYAVSPARPSRPEVVVKRAQSPDPNAPTSPAAAVRSTRIFHILAGVSARRARGLSLLVSLSMVVVVASLAGFSVLPWWSVPVAVAVLAADVAWLRHIARSKRADRKVVAPTREAEPAELQAAEPAELPAAEPAELPAAETTGSLVEVDPYGWDPVPVPPPTYTLKAKAAPRVPAAITEPGPGQPWSLDGLVYDCELDELVEQRRTAGG